MRRVLIVVTLVLIAPAHAVAAAPWGPAQELPGAGGVIVDPVLRFGSGSTGVATRTVIGSAGRSLSILPATAGQAPSTVRDVQSVLGGPFPYAGTRTLSLRRRTVRAGRTRLGFSFGRTSGEVGRFRTLDVTDGTYVQESDFSVEEATLAVGPDGGAAIAYTERAGKKNVSVTRLRLAVRRAGSSSFGAPRVVRGSGRQSGLALAVGGDGRVVLAYQQNSLTRPIDRHVEARLAATDGNVRSLQKLGSSVGEVQIAAVAPKGGRVTVAWATFDGGIEQNVPTEIRAASVADGSTSFSNRQLVDRGASVRSPARAQGPLSVGSDVQGRATMAYTLSGAFTTGSERTPARVATQTSTGAFGAPETLTEDGIAGRVAVSNRGETVIPFVAGGSQLTDDVSSLRAALRAPGATGFTFEDIDPNVAAVAPSATFEPDGTIDALWATELPDRSQAGRFARRTGP